MAPSTRIAAIDLGSNSFHLLIARATTRGYRILTRQRQKVRLADGLNADHYVDDAALERGVTCLTSFAELLQQYQPIQVRCVATATLRLASNRKQLLKRFEQALGYPIDVISGSTEANLIYQGATAELKTAAPMLVLDIGGASTEVIAGVGTEPHVLKSLNMGCVVWQNRYFADGSITAERFAAATAAARAFIEPLAATYKAHGWQHVCGASGTFRALQDYAREQYHLGAIEAAMIRQCQAAAIAVGSRDKLATIGIRDDRIAVFCGGLAILLALLDSLAIAEIDLAQGALREGLVHAMLDERKRSLS